MIRSSIEAQKILKWSELENNTKISRDSLEKFHSPKCSLLDAASKHSSKNSNRAYHRSKWSGIGAAGKDSRKNQSPKWLDREATSLGNQSPKWLDSEASDVDDNRRSSWGPLCRSQAVVHDGDINRGTNRWGTDLDQTGSDAWGHHSPSISPGRWNMSNRSRSRSPYGLKHGFEDLNDRGRMAMGGSSPLYSDFAERRHSGRNLDNKSSKWPELGKNSARIYKDDSDNSHNQIRRITNWGSDLDRTGAEWTRHSHSISPKGHWNRSSRRRSRSPPYGLMHESESWDNQDRIGMGESVAPSQDFAAGRCKSQWRDLHEDGARRHPDSGREGIREGKRMRYLGYDSREIFSDSSERRDYLRDRLFQRHGTHTTDEDDNEQHRDRGFRATCYDFLKGRCRRGSTCKFVHHDALPNAGRFMEDAPRGKAYHGRDLDASYLKRTEFQMTSNAPCKYFADGYCRRGEDCNFSHQHMPRRHSDDRLHDDKCYNRGNEKSSSWNGPKWGDSTTVDAPNTSLNGPKWGDRPATADVPKSSSEVRNWGDKTTVDASKSSWPKWSDQSSSADAFISSWNGPKWGDLGTPVNASNSLEHKRGDQTDKVDAPISSLNGQQLVDPATVNSTKRDEQTTIMDAPNSFSKDPNWGDEATTVDSPHSPHWVNNGVRPGATIMDPLHIEDTTPEPLYSPSQNLEDDGYQKLQEEASPTARPSENQSLIQEAPGKLQNVLIVSAQTMAESTYAQSHPCTGAEMVSCTSETVDASCDKVLIEKNVNFLTAASAPEKNFCKCLPQDQNEKAQLSFNLNSPPHDHLLSPRNNMAPQPSDPQSSKSDGQSDQEISQQVMDSQNMQIIGEEVMPNAKPSEIKCSQSSPDTSITQKLTTSKQIARISERPASMGHILGNGQQLPQPHIFKPIDCTDLASWSSFSNPSAAAAAPFVQHNQGSLPTERVTLDSSNVPPVLPSMYVDREASKITQESQTAKRSNPVSVTQGPHEGDPNKYTNVEFKRVELDEDTAKGVIDTRNGKGMKEIKTTMSEDANAEIRAKVENKTINDEKVIRMFKFAIADFAKDILKPSWKEGHLSKEAHKTIVKKVVDKVTGTLEGNFPRTQEQIDLYLSYSKTKLTNLVQAYLGKLVKS